MGDSSTTAGLSRMLSMLSLLLSSLLVTVVVARVGTKAASPFVNCGCQCSSLTFRDKWGEVQGNCRSSDHSGAKWCYVNSWSSPCQDLQKSNRFRQPWSYEACATPPRHLCNPYGGGSGGGGGRWGCNTGSSGSSGSSGSGCGRYGCNTGSSGSGS